MPTALGGLCILVLSWAVAVQAPAQANQAKPIRVLFTYGGHGFDETEFYRMFDALPGMTYTRALLPRDADLLRPGLEKQYDVIVMYDMAGKFTPRQEQNLIELLKTGIGVVSLHHNLCSHEDWPQYGQIIGGRYFQKPETIDGKAFAPSHYLHDQHMEVKIADADHPITLGLSDFHMDDETYWDFWVSPDSHVLLTVDHPRCGHNVAWVTQFGNSRVFYLMFGHGPSAWRNPIYQQLLIRGIHWASERTTSPAQAK